MKKRRICKLHKLHWRAKKRWIWHLHKLHWRAKKRWIRQLQKLRANKRWIRQLWQLYILPLLLRWIKLQILLTIKLDGTCYTWDVLMDVLIWNWMTSVLSFARKSLVGKTRGRWFELSSLVEIHPTFTLHFPSFFG